MSTQYRKAMFGDFGYLLGAKYKSRISMGRKNIIFMKTISLISKLVKFKAKLLLSDYFYVN